MTLADRVRLRELKLLSDNHYVLRRATFDWRRADGEWQTQQREVYDRGDGVCLLPYNIERRTVILIRQFRYPAYANGYDQLLIEVPAGVLDKGTPEERVRGEVEEETGYRLGAIRKIFESFMSPGAVTERLHFFVAEYDPAMRVSDGGGEIHEGEDIEVLEPTIDEAMAMIADGRIMDGKTIMLLQWAKLNLFP